MIKSKKGIDYSNVTLNLVNQVNDVIADSKKHTYSVSKVYKAHNSAFGLRETPQTCSSCLRNRVRDLMKWIDGYYDYLKKQAPKVEVQPITSKASKKKTSKKQNNESESKG